MATQAAQLALRFEVVVGLLQPVLKALDLRMLRDGAGGAQVDLPGGRLLLVQDNADTRLTLEAVDEARLARLRDAISHYAGDHGLCWQADRQPCRPENFSLARIARNERLSPSFRRLRLAGDFARFREGGPHFRLIFGPEGADWPHCDQTGATIWPGGVDVWHRPPYTVRALDPEARWLDVDVVLHDGGRVTDWAGRSRPGDLVALTGPGGKAPQAAGWVAYIGDETALPVIARRLETLPRQTRGVARLFVADPRDRQPIAHPAGVDLQWRHHRDGRPLDEITALTPPASDRFVFFAGERAQAAAARDRLGEAGFQRGEFHAAAYWTEGWVPPPDQVARLARRP